MRKLKINFVLEGKGKDGKVLNGFNGHLNVVENVESYPLEKKTVSSYELIDENNKDQYSFWKGALGVALLGGLGAVAGLGGKQKKEYLIAINWKDGDKSLILLDDSHYKVLLKSLF